MLNLTLKNILFRKMRALLTVVGITSSITLVVFMSFIMSSMEKSLTDSLSGLGGLVRIQPKSAALDGVSVTTVPDGLFLSQEDVNQIMAQATGYDPAASSATIEQALVPPLSPNSPPQVTLKGLQSGHEASALTGFEAESGQLLLTGARQVILGADAAKYLSTKAGHTLTAGERIALPALPGEWQVVGIARKHDLFSDTMVIAPLADTQAALKRGDAVNYVALTYPVDQAKTAAAALKAKLPDLDVVTNDAMLASADKALTAQRSFFSMINGTAYATAIAILFMVMYAAVMERTREIGTMRAVGVPRTAVVGGILLEALLFTMAGAVLASIIAFLIIDNWEMATPAAFALHSLKVIAGALVVALLSSLYPALRAARINPLEALRYE